MKLIKLISQKTYLIQSLTIVIVMTMAAGAFADPRVHNTGNFLGYEIPKLDDLTDSTNELLNKMPDTKDLLGNSYTLVPVEPQCTNADIMVGVGTGLVVGTVVGIVATVGMPIAMPVTATTAVLTGTKVTLTEAIKKPEVGMILASNAILAPITGSVAYTVSCAWDPISNFSSSKYNQFKDFTSNKFNYYWGS